MVSLTRDPQQVNPTSGPTLDPWEIEADPADWPEDTDADRWELRPNPDDDCPLPEPEPFHPDPAEEAWWARESNARDFDDEPEPDWDELAAESAALDRLEAGYCL